MQMLPGERILLESGAKALCYQRSAFVTMYAHSAATTLSALCLMSYHLAVLFTPRIHGCSRPPLSRASGR
jgi:hypothetical protein